MGFYNSKLNKYTKSISFSTEQLDATKERIIDQKKKYIEDLKNDMHISRVAGIEGDYDEYESEQESYFLSLKELDFIQTMSTPDFYQYLISLENYTLTKVEDKAFSDMAKNVKTMSKYRAQKGLVGKASALLGTSKKIIERNGKEFELNNFTADFTQATRKEWQAISPENQALYIAGRFEIDKLVGFDKEGFEAYRNQAFQKETKQVEESAAGLEQ